MVSSLRRVASVERPVVLSSARPRRAGLSGVGIGLGSRGRMIVGSLPTGLKIVLVRSVWLVERGRKHDTRRTDAPWNTGLTFCVAREPRWLVRLVRWNNEAMAVTGPTG